VLRGVVWVNSNTNIHRYTMPWVNQLTLFLFLQTALHFAAAGGHVDAVRVLAPAVRFTTRSFVVLFLSCRGVCGVVLVVCLCV